MNELWYAFFILGGFSTGYSLLRTGFPSFQLKEKMTKLALSYLLGAVVFGLAALSVVLLGIDSDYFFAISFGFYAIVFVVLFVKRFTYKETDPRIQKESKKHSATPLRVLTKEEKERKGIIEPNKINFEDGLMVKTKHYAVNPEDIKKQVFKEKDNTILNAIDRKTKDLVIKDNEVQKREALAKLKEMAKGIIGKKKEIEDAEKMDTVEEDLLNNLGDDK